VILPRLGASDAAPSSPNSLSARTRRPSARPSQAPPPAKAPRTTASAHSTHHRQHIAGGCKHALTAQLPPMHAAYLRGPATSAAPSFRDSVPATLPQLLRTRCLRAPPPLGSPLASPTTRYSLAHHHPTRNTHHPCFSGVRKHTLTAQAAADARSVQLRSSDVSCVILPRLGASDAAPSSPIPLSARTRRPSARPSQAPPPATASRPTAPANNTQHHQIAGGRKHALTAQAQPMHAAYFGGPASSAASSFRDSVPATLPQLLR
jgi:hypothetical protein